MHFTQQGSFQIVTPGDDTRKKLVAELKQGAQIEAVRAKAYEAGISTREFCDMMNESRRGLFT